MSKKFLIVGNKPISGAIVSTLSLLNSYNFVQINPLEFPDLEMLVDNLEGIKDDNSISAIIISDFLTFNEKYPISNLFGIELIKHIRLTDSLGSLCLLPIVLLSLEKIMHHLKSKRDNIILASPCCYPIYVPFFISEFFNTINELKCFESQEEMRNVLNEYIVWSKEDDVVSKHDNFNRYGPFKLIEEFYGDGDRDEMPDLALKDYREITRKLWFKKYQFLDVEKSTLANNQDIHEFNENDYKRATSNIKVLYIDDEHRLGWSFALFSIVFYGSNNNNDLYQLFQEDDHYIATPDGDFVCIDNYEEAARFLESHKDNFENSLKEFTEAEFNNNRIAKQFETVSRNFEKIKQDYDSIKKEYEINERETKRTEDQLEEKQKVLDESNCKHFELVENYKNPKTDERISPVDLSTLSTKIVNLCKDIHQIQNNLQKKKKEGEKLHEKLEAADTKYLELEQKSTEIKDFKSKAEETHKKAYDKFKSYDFNEKILDFDLVFLDLRLKVKDDNGQGIDGMPKGVALLKKIKEVDTSTPVIVFTASEKAVNYREVIDFGASGYWIKVVNTVNDLKRNILSCLHTGKDIRNIWFKIKKVETKKELIWFHEDRSKKELQRKVMDSDKKGKIISLLKESFLLLQKDLTSYEKSIFKYTNYSKIALNMGLIQEERLNLSNKNDYNVLLRWIENGIISGEEKDIRDSRRKAAHSQWGETAKKEAIVVFVKTLDMCLAYS
jgi:CheY-like chemotaxis protein